MKKIIVLTILNLTKLCSGILFTFSFQRLALALCLGGLLFTSCASRYLKVTGANSHTSCGGKVVRNSINCGIEYYIYLSPVNKDITFDSLYVDNLSINLEPSSVQIHAASNNYIIHVVYRYGSTRQSTQESRFTGKGLVLYKYKGRPHTVTIDTIVRLRPSKNS